MGTYAPSNPSIPSIPRERLEVNRQALMSRTGRGGRPAAVNFEARYLNGLRVLRLDRNAVTDTGAFLLVRAITGKLGGLADGSSEARADGIDSIDGIEDGKSLTEVPPLRSSVPAGNTQLEVLELYENKVKSILPRALLLILF